MIIAADSFSTVIEIVQYIGGYGFAELDDVICNTLGAMISFWIFLGLKRGMDETL
ncbi:MAG: VanZ family protein [Lachnospiraceae bacterium]|nr:VanZ family protein [Lachnospiraceae bacterium]